jgi:hypothetical protein
VMPVLVVVEVPGGSSALDEALTKAWYESGSPPAGNRLRIAGPMDGGWRIVSLWDSREQFRDFMRERLHLTLDDLGNGQPTITIWDVETVHAYG